MKIRFSEIRKYPEGATPAEVTKYNMDHSYALETLLTSDVYRTSGTEWAILGETQFAFICFLIGQVYDAFDQWKRLVHLVCHSEEAMAKHPELYSRFISMLHFQVRLHVYT